MPATIKDKKVILHELAINYSNPIKGIYDFDQNGIFFAEGGDILVTRSKVNDSYLNLLIKLGINLDNVKYLCSKEVLLDSIKKNFFYNGGCSKELKILLQENNDYSLDSFMVTDAQVEWASQTNVNCSVKAGQFNKFASKSAFRKSAQSAGVAIARGFNYSNNSVETIAKIGYLFLTGFNIVALKYDYGSAGIGIYKIEKSEFLNHLENIDSFLSGKALGVQGETTNNFVIEGWYEDVLYSPSVQFYVDQLKKVSLVSMHVQLFYEDNVTYKGCMSADSIDKNIQEVLLERGSKLAMEMASNGYIGHVGFNAIVLKNEEVIWVEANPRRVMSSYAYQISKRLLKENDAMSYVASHIKKDSWVGKNIQDIITDLDKVIFNPITKSGVVPYDYSVLESEGRLTLIAFSTDTKDAVRLLKYAENN